MIFEIVLSGILVGGLYALMAIGLTLVLGVMRVLNLAHGVFFMLGCFSCYFLLTQAALNPVLALFLTVSIGFLIAISIERLVVRPTKKDLMRMCVATLSVAVLLEEAVRLNWGKIYRAVNPYIRGTTDLVGVTFDNQRIVAFLLSLVIITGLVVCIKKSRFGRAMRMVQQDEDMAALLGVNVRFINTMVFGIAGALISAAAGLLSPLYMIYPSMGWPPLLKCFSIVILGGMGSIGGTIFAGFIFGVVEIGTAFFFGSQWAYGAVFLILVVILLSRPRGLFGKDIF